MPVAPLEAPRRWALALAGREGKLLAILGLPVPWERCLEEATFFGLWALYRMVCKEIVGFCHIKLDSGS